MRTAETAFDMLRISKIAARNPVTHFMSLPSGSSKLIGSLCVMREAATVLIQVHGFVWALCSACPAELPEVRRAPTMFRPCRRVGKWGRRDVCCWHLADVLNRVRCRGQREHRGPAVVKIRSRELVRVAFQYRRAGGEDYAVGPRRVRPYGAGGGGDGEQNDSHKPSNCSMLRHQNLLVLHAHSCGSRKLREGSAVMRQVWTAPEQKAVTSAIGTLSGRPDTPMDVPPRSGAPGEGKSARKHAFSARRTSGSDAHPPATFAMMPFTARRAALCSTFPTRRCLG